MILLLWRSLHQIILTYFSLFKKIMLKCKRSSMMVILHFHPWSEPFWHRPNRLPVFTLKLKSFSHKKMYRISKTLWWTLWPRFYWIWCQSFYQILTKMAAILVTIMATMPAKNLWKIQWSLSIILVTIMAKKSGIMLAKISGECLDIKNLLFGWPGTANTAENVLK